MSSVLRTIDSLREVHVRDYVEFHQGKLGYVETITPPENVRIIEDDRISHSTLILRYNVKQHKVSLIANQVIVTTITEC